MEGTMPLMLTEVRVWNADPKATYRLIIKDGDEIVGQNNAIGPIQPGSVPALRVPITGPLTLTAEKV